MSALKSVGVGSACKVLGVLYAVLGFIGGALFSAFALMGAAAGSSEMGPLAMLFGVGAIIILPIVYGILGAIGGAIMALIYNVCAKMTGGLELEIE